MTHLRKRLCEKVILKERHLAKARCFFHTQRAVVGNAFMHSGVVVSVTAERINPFPAKALPIPVYRAGMHPRAIRDWESDGIRYSAHRPVRYRVCQFPFVGQLRYGDHLPKTLSFRGCDSSRGNLPEPRRFIGKVEKIS